MRGWLELVRKGVMAVAGLCAFVATMYGGMAAIWLAMKAPESFALVASASIIAAALYMRKPATTYNMQMSHHDTERVIAAVNDLLRKQTQRTN